jgi:cholesterol oxidase
MAHRYVKNIALCLSAALVAAACADDTLESNEPNLQLVAELSAAGDYKAIIVGSGYGGSVAALRLAEKGVQTLVLERGRRWTVQDATRDATFGTLDAVMSNLATPGNLHPDSGKTTWVNTRCVGNLYLTFIGGVPCPRTTGVLEVVDGTPETHRDFSPALQIRGVSAIVAAAVGGGSVINNGITYAPTELGWNTAYPPAELPWMGKVWKDLSKKYFAMARNVLAPAAPPADVVADPRYRATQLMLQHAALAGYPSIDPYDPATLMGVSLAPVLVDWAKVREELSGARVESVVRGEAWWGTNSGARKSLDTAQSYLGRAEATGRVTVKPLHTVSAIRFDPRTKLYTVEVTQTDEAYNALATLQFTTRNLIMSAGSLGTTKLLVRARETGALPLLNEHVGSRFSTNGGTLHLRMTAETSAIGQGGTAGVRINDFREPGNPVVLENLPQRVPAIPNLAPFTRAIFSVGIGIPTGKGSFSYDAASDKVILDWPAGAAANVYDRVTALYEALPGATLFPSLKNIAASQQNTLHPLGGVPLGLATNKHCKLKGYKRLYAVDGAVLPNASAVANPSMLITAMAERCMAKVVGSIVDENDAWEDDSYDDTND